MFDSTSRFLVVDDSEASRRIVKSALQQLKYKHIDEAVNGEVAWVQIVNAKGSGDPYSMVFLDITMPGMDGFAFLANCRKSNDFSELPIVMITTESKKDSVVRAVMEGVSGYLVKPFAVEDIKGKLLEIATKTKALR